MKARIKTKIGPYQGPFEKIITYRLELNNNNIVVWHENGKRNFPNLNTNDIIEGLIVKKINNKVLPDYRNSIIKKYSNQILIF